jgi:photosystem I P700 chlorophyll a apoprotein A1
MVRDYEAYSENNLPNNLLDRLISHRDSVLAHLRWVSIFLGFHRFGLYVHNDTLSALGRPNDMFSDGAIQLQPIFAQRMQKFINQQFFEDPREYLSNFSKNPYGLVVGGKIAKMSMPLGTADFLIHHIHAFTIHVTVLILLKGFLFSRNSRLITDKSSLGFRFPCDGPGRGGTCQVSAWDHVFLGLF